MKTAEETKENIMAIISDAVTLRKINSIHKKRIEIILDQFKQPIAEGETVYRKVSVKERLPDKTASYHTDKGIVNYFHGIGVFEHSIRVDYWLEETTIPLSVNMPSGEAKEKFLIDSGIKAKGEIAVHFFNSCYEWIRSQIKPSVPAKSIEECLNEVAKKYQYIDFMQMIFSLSRGENFDIKAPQRIKEAMQLYFEHGKPAISESDAIAFADWLLQKRCEADSGAWSVGDIKFKDDYYKSAILYGYFKSEK